jgi:hypothetical protein
VADTLVPIPAAATPGYYVENDTDGTHSGDGLPIVVQKIVDKKVSGTPGYHAGSGGGTFTLSAGVRLVAVSAVVPPGGAADGYVTLDGGDHIPVRASGPGLVLEPRGNWVATVVVISSQCDYYVEWVA